MIQPEFDIKNGVLQKYNGNGSEVVIPDTVTMIGPYAFNSCINLISVSIPDSVQNIGSDAFNGCRNLASVVIPGSVKGIGSSAFNKCSNLTNLIISDGVTQIGNFSFSHCSNLKSISIPGSVTNIGDWAFSECCSLTELIICPGAYTIIGRSAFTRCSSLTSISIPGSVCSIGDYSFSDCHGITNLEISTGVQKIGQSAFSRCDGLTSIILPDSIMTIGWNAFEYCRNLSEIIVPPGIENFSPDAFNGCTKLQETTGDFFILGTYLMKYKGKENNVVIPSEVEVILDDVFANHNEIVSVSFPTEIKKIGNRSFKNCSELSNITIPDGVTTVGDGTFSGCGELTGISLPESITTIGCDAFYNCKKLKEITIPCNVISIGEDAFRNCKDLHTIIVEGPAEIKKGAFWECDNIQTIIIRNNKCKIKKDAFEESFYTKFISQIHSLYPMMDDSAIINNIFRCGIWENLTPELQAEIYLCRQGKSLKNYYIQHITNANAVEFSKALFAGISKDTNSKNCDAVGNFLAIYYTLIPKDITEKIFRKLKAGKPGLKVAQKLESDAAFMAFMDSGSQEENALPLVEEKVRKILQDQNLTLNNPELDLKQYYGLNPDELPSIIDKEENEISAMVKSWLLTVHEGWEQYSGNRGEVKEVYKAPGISPTAQGVVDMLDSESFHKALMKLADENLGGMGKRLGVAFPICRYADEKEMEILTKRASQWRSGTSGNNAPPLLTFRQASLYSNTKAALLLAEKYDKEWMNDLHRYANMRGMDVDALRDQLISDTGLDANRSKTYDLGNQCVKIHLGKDLDFTIELPDGKAAKTLPKKNSDPDKFAAANEDFISLKKNIKKIIKNRINSLFDDFLNGKTRKAQSWQGSYLGNPILRDIASLLVWEQDGNTFRTFTLTESGAIDSSGNPYVLSDKDIRLAYPAEMDVKDLAAWQDYFSSHNLKQPFLQLWEPILNLKEITPDRYKGDRIPYYRFLHQEKHGITVESSYHGDYYECHFEGCSGNIQRIDGWGHIEASDLFEVIDFAPNKNGYKNRYANHIVAYLDRITIWERIQKDDATIFDLLPQFTAAQINEFISIATEAHAVNVTAMLMEYKNTNYPDLDPLAEFTLDYI